MAPRRGAAAAAREALIEAIALDIIYEAARAATDETGAEVAAEVMAASGLGSQTQAHTSKDNSTTFEQALHHRHATRTRSTRKASQECPAQPSPKRPWLCTPATYTRRLTAGF